MNDGRNGLVGRIDRTPGTFRVSQSPFGTAGRLITALITKTGKAWTYRSCYIGGQGMIPCAVEDGGNGLKQLWMDSTGRWWLQYEVMRGHWLPDTEATLDLLNRPELGDDVTSMSAEHIRYGQA